MEPLRLPRLGREPVNARAQPRRRPCWSCATSASGLGNRMRVAQPCDELDVDAVAVEIATRRRTGAPRGDGARRRRSDGDRGSSYRRNARGDPTTEPHRRPRAAGAFAASRPSTLIVGKSEQPSARCARDDRAAQRVAAAEAARERVRGRRRRSRAGSRSMIPARPSSVSDRRDDVDSNPRARPERPEQRRRRPPGCGRTRDRGR